MDALADPQRGMRFRHRDLNFTVVRREDCAVQGRRKLFGKGGYSGWLDMASGQCSYPEELGMRDQQGRGLVGSR